MIPTTRNPEDVWDLLYSIANEPRVPNAVDFYYSRIYGKGNSQNLNKALIRTWVNTYGRRVIKKAKRIIGTI